MTNNGYELIKRFEGLRNRAYKPVASEKYFTIGYGHYGADVDEYAYWSTELCEEVLRKDVSMIEYQLRLFMPTTLQYNLNRNQWDAIVSFCFNLGVASFHKSTLYKKIKANPNDEAGIREQWMKWVYAGGKVLKGLQTRRQTEVDLYFTPINKEHKCNLK